MSGEVHKGTMRVETKTEDGYTLTEEHGFTFQEESGRKLAFDIYEHETGIALLFGEQVFFLGFWTDEQLDKAEKSFLKAVRKERKRRQK